MLQSSQRVVQNTHKGNTLLAAMAPINQEHILAAKAYLGSQRTNQFSLVGELGYAGPTVTLNQGIATQASVPAFFGGQLATGPLTSLPGSSIGGAAATGTVVASLSAGLQAATQAAATRQAVNPSATHSSSSSSSLASAGQGVIHVSAVARAAFISNVPYVAYNPNAPNVPSNNAHLLNPPAVGLPSHPAVAPPSTGGSTSNSSDATVVANSAPSPWFYGVPAAAAAPPAPAIVVIAVAPPAAAPPASQSSPEADSRGKKRTRH